MPFAHGFMIKVMCKRHLGLKVNSIEIVLRKLQSPSYPGSNSESISYILRISQLNSCTF